MATGFPSFDNLSGGLEPRKTYLLNGDKESGKEYFAYKLAVNSLAAKTGVVYITTNKSYTDLISEFNSRSLPISQYLGSTLKILDSFTRSISPTATDNQYTKILNGPLDLTGLSVALSNANAEFLKDARPVINVFDSVSSLLLYNNPATFFRFMQFICGRAKMSGVMTIFLLDNQMHANEVNETIKSLTDAIISLKVQDGKRYFRLTGTAKEVLNWEEL